MKYVRIEQGQDPWLANILDPTEYISKLEELSKSLPSGARSYSLSSGHYDPCSPWCVKDLKLKEANLSVGETMSLRLSFLPNQFKHESGLVINYVDVSSFSVSTELEGESDPLELGDLQLDEILPHQVGCSHEISFTGGSIFVVCRDLRAYWG